VLAYQLIHSGYISAGLHVRKKTHLHVAAQVCVAEGAGQKLVADANQSLDASGNACAHTQPQALPHIAIQDSPGCVYPLPQYTAGMLQRAAMRSVR
jgi:hypothetical protein